MKHFIHAKSSQNPITLLIFLKSYLYQSNLDYPTFPAILKFSMKHINTIKISLINLCMTTNFNTNHQITKMKTNVNRSKIAKETSPGSSHLFLKNVSNNIGKYFLLSIQQHFLNNHVYHKIFNKNNVKTSYSSMANIKKPSIYFNKEVITKKKHKKYTVTCR